jgi:hemerythrin
MPIIWRAQMSVGNDLIDQDHRYLFCLVNSIELALKLDEDTEALLTLVRQLADYSRFHFQREETIQRKVSYPQLAHHAQVHQTLLENIGQLEKDVREYHEHASAGTLVDGERDLVTQSVMQLLRAWILDHVLKEDKRMENYLRKMPPNFE